MSVVAPIDGRVRVGFPHIDESTGTCLAKISPDCGAKPYPDVAPWSSSLKEAEAAQTFVRVNA
jgi:hypothetical protein